MTKKYTYEEVLGQFQGQIEQWKNDGNRVPSRAVPTKADVLKYAKKLRNEQYKDALHPSVLDRYK